MANALYPNWKRDLMQATANTSLAGSGTTGTYCALVNTTSYTYSSAHTFYASVIGSPDAVIGTDQEITGKAFTNVGPLTGPVFSGSNLTYTAVSGQQIGALVIYVKNAGANTTWYLVLYEDTSVTGLPVTPNGGNITVSWSTTTSPDTTGIFALSDGDAKEAFVKLGRVGPADVYEFSYRGSKERHVGLVAQQVEQFAPDAVRVFGGRRHVDYKIALDKAVKLAA